MSVLENWDQWKNFLGDRLDNAQEQGMSQKVIHQMAHQVGDYLANEVDPKMNKNVYFQILVSCSEEEQQVIASVMVKLVENNSTN